MPAMRELVKKSLRAIMEETYEDVKGYYLDKKTSLFETLEGIDAEAASRKRGNFPETIAAHVYHVRFYNDVLRRYMNGPKPEKVDWKESWTVTSVTPEEWKALKDGLAEDYRKLLEDMDGDEDWEKEDFFDGVLGILAHTAYHVGAIRHLMDV